MKKAVLLINLGSPDRPTIFSVWRYLRQFLMDPRVIDIPYLFRYILVNLIIIPLRVANSTKEYKHLWNLFGCSPLIKNLSSLSDTIQLEIGNKADVYHAMRYQDPSIDRAMESIYKNSYDELIILPLYPQYASASTGSTIEYCNNIMKGWWNIPKVRTINHFYSHPAYINAFVENIRSAGYSSYDHILFSYHGLPDRHVDKTYPGSELCADNSCEDGITESNRFCYKAQCYETTKLIVGQLSLDDDRYSVSFQSRLNQKWIKPYTDIVMLDLIKKNKKNVLVVSPAFISDCLETSIEISKVNRDIFIKGGGEELTLVPSLNYSKAWAKGVIEIIRL